MPIDVRREKSQRKQQARCKDRQTKGIGVAKHKKAAANRWGGKSGIGHDLFTVNIILKYMKMEYFQII